MKKMKIAAIGCADVYYLDNTGKILESDNLYVGDASGGFQTLKPGDKIKSGFTGGAGLPEGTDKIFIYNLHM